MKHITNFLKAKNYKNDVYLLPKTPGKGLA